MPSCTTFGLLSIARSAQIADMFDREIVQVEVSSKIVSFVIVVYIQFMRQ